jgi:hypothetical protein
MKFMDRFKPYQYVDLKWFECKIFLQIHNITILIRTKSLEVKYNKQSILTFCSLNLYTLLESK